MEKTKAIIASYTGGLDFLTVTTDSRALGEGWARPAEKATFHHHPANRDRGACSEKERSALQ